MTPSRHRLALVGLFGGATALGFAPIFVRLSEVGPSTTAFWRLALALPLLGAFHAWGRRRSAPAGARAQAAAATRARPLVLAGLLFAADLAVWHWSIRYTSVANSTLLANCAPLFVVLGAWLLWGQRFRRTFLAAMALTIAGAALLVSHSLQLDPEHLWGDTLGLTTAVFYGGYLLAVKRLRDDVSTATVMWVSGLVTALALLPVALLSESTFIPPTPRAWAVLAGLAVVSHVAGQGLVAWAVAHLPVAFSSVGLLLQPAVAALLAWHLFDEALDAWQGLGAAIVLVGIALARRST